MEEDAEGFKGQKKDFLPLQVARAPAAELECIVVWLLDLSPV